MTTTAMENFLVPDATLFIEVFAFNLVLFVVAKYVLPRLRTAVEARQVEIQRGLANAAEAEKLEQAAEVEAGLAVRHARHEAADITEKAREMRDAIIVEGRRDGRAQYEWLAGRADREMARREEQLRRQFELRATKAAVAAVGQLVGPADVDRLAAAIAEALDAPTRSRRAQVPAPTARRVTPASRTSVETIMSPERVPPETGVHGPRWKELAVPGITVELPKVLQS
jgi:F-type H+-transporting ATPase subunit b